MKEIDEEIGQSRKGICKERTNTGELVIVYVQKNRYFVNYHNHIVQQENEVYWLDVNWLYIGALSFFRGIIFSYVKPQSPLYIPMQTLPPSIFKFSIA